MGDEVAELHSTSLGPGLPSWSHIKEQPCLSTCAGWSLFRFPLCWSSLSHFRCIQTYRKYKGRRRSDNNAVWGEGMRERGVHLILAVLVFGDVSSCTVVSNCRIWLRTSAYLWPMMLTFKCNKRDNRKTTMAVTDPFLHPDFRHRRSHACASQTGITIIH